MRPNYVYLVSSCMFRIVPFHHGLCKSYAKFYLKDMIKAWEKVYPGEGKLPLRNGMDAVFIRYYGTCCQL